MSEDRDALRSLILRTLDDIKDPCSVASGAPMGLSEMGLVGSLDISAGGVVRIEMRLTSPFCHMIGFFKVDATRRLLELPGVTQVELTGDTGLDWSPQRISATAQARRTEHLRRMNSKPPAT